LNKIIEVEIRGPLDQDGYSEVLDFLNKNGTFVKTKNRVMIDYSTLNETGGMESRTKDIRLRVTNGIPEVMIKIGSWGESEARRELSILTKKGTFDDLVEIFGHLGWKKGMLCVRNSEVFLYKSVEFSLVEVPGHSYYFEAELMISESDSKKEAVKKIKNICKEMGLVVFSKKAFFRYVGELNEEVNEIFDFDQYSVGYFKKRFLL